MNLALVGGQRREPLPGLKGNCPGCGELVVAKCGPVNIWHWSHLGRRDCDPWWENETAWHQSWKGEFPEDWREIHHPNENGKWHRADVKTDQDWVIEFQFSHLNSEERLERESFYKKLVWVVSGKRLIRDQEQFFNALNSGRTMLPNPRVIRLYPDDCRLVREWFGNRAPVFFDFGERDNLWCLLPESPDGQAYIVLTSRKQFIEIHRMGTPLDALSFADQMAGYCNSVTQYLMQAKENAEAADRARYRALVQHVRRRRNHYL